MPASPLLLLVPYRYKAAVLYSQIPISASASGDFVVSRAGNTASRILGNGNIETGVLANIARINYPRTGVASGCAGLLVEPAATNSVLQSEAFNTGWSTQAGATVTPNTIAAPDNNVTADTINLSTTSDSRVQQGLITIANSTTYTMSCFYKNIALTAAETFRMRFNNTNAAPNNFVANTIINLASGTATYSIAGTSGTGFSGTATGRVENYGNGWYRVSMTFTVGSAGGTSAGIFEVGNNNSLALRSFYAWGAQLETGSIATSYIPTTTGTVTRNADVITNNQFVIPNLIGAILTEFESPTSGTYFVDNLPVTLVSGYNKVAISYTPTTITVYRNGTQVSGSPFSPPGGVLPILGNVINIGHNNQYYQLGANIRSFVLYSSTLTAAEASGLTT